jgi:hypothetical protein
MTDFRALCEELVDVCDFPSPFHYKADVINRARVALAEQPGGPTDEELRELRRQHDWPVVDSLLFSIARAVLAKWGAPAIEPVVPLDKLDRLIALDRDDPANVLPVPAND